MKQNYFLMFLLILGVQLLICNYLHITAYLTLSLLPCAILLLPTKVGTTASMLIAFASGLTVDVLAEGVVGLNALALVPVAGAPEMDLRHLLRKGNQPHGRGCVNDEVRPWENGIRTRHRTVHLPADLHLGRRLGSQTIDVQLPQIHSVPADRNNSLTCDGESSGP